MFFSCVWGYNQKSFDFYGIEIRFKLHDILKERKVEER